MVFNKDAIYILETCNIKLNDEALVKLEDGLRHKKEQLLTIDASHYAFFNGNGTIYRHDTVQLDIPSFVRPSPKPIIEGHRPKTSDVFGRVIAADYKLTDYYDSFSKSVNIEGLNTEEYINMCKDHLIPLQRRDSNFNGLSYVQVVGKLDHEDAIKKVLDREFITVSIGAFPKKMICSECLQDQTQRMCNHYPNRKSGVFMLAESLEYDELSFVKKPADPFGKVVVVHDGKVQEYQFEKEFETINANVGVMDVHSFFNNINTGKKIVCVDNICTIIHNDQEDDKMLKQNVSLVTEFGEDKLKSLDIKISDSEDSVSVEKFKLCDEDFKGMKHTQFAVVQKTQDGEKRRLPIHDAEHVLACAKLLADAQDLTETELELAKARIEKAAKKFGLEVVFDSEEQSIEDNKGEEGSAEEGKLNDAGSEETPGTEKASAEEIEKLLEQVKAGIHELREKFMSLEIKDEVAGSPEKNPVTKIFELLKWFANDVKWASESLNSQVCGYLEECGKVAMNKGMFDEMEAKISDFEKEKTDLVSQLDSVKAEKVELEDEVKLLDSQNIDLNYQLRAASVEELVSHKKRLGLIEDSEESLSTEKDKLFKLPFSVLKDSVNEFRTLAQKINKEDVNNNTTQLSSVADPTLQDSVNTDLETLENQDSHKKITEEQVRKALQSLRPNAFRSLFGK